MQSIPDPEGAVLRAALPIALLALLPSMAGAQQSPPPPIAPPVAVGTVPNGDLAAGLDGWGAVGPGLSLVGGPVIQAADNTSVVSPPVTVPSAGQAISIVMGVPGANAVVDVRARPVEGGAEIPLDSIVPDRAVRAWSVGVGALRGRTVRFVLDPVASLGRRLYVRSIGPVQEVLPGWEVATGLPQVRAAWGRTGIVAEDSPLSVRTPPVVPPAGTRFLGLAVRGTGAVRAATGGSGRRVVASPDRWTALRVPVTSGGGAVRMAVVATPAPGERMALSGVATPVRAVRVTGVAVRGGVVRATLRPAIPGIRAEVRIGTTVVGRSTARPDGALVIRARGSGAARLVVPDDASVIGTSVPIALPG